MYSVKTIKQVSLKKLRILQTLNAKTLTLNKAVKNR